MQKQLLEKENNLGGLTMKKFLKQLLNKRLNNEKGLTLIELLAVIVILAIVAAIAVPAIGNIINNSRVDAIKSDAINAINAAGLYFIENSNDNDVTVQELQNAGFLETVGSLDPDGTTITEVANGEDTIDGSGTNGDITITFNYATITEINAHTSDNTIGNGNGTD